MAETYKQASLISACSIKLVANFSLAALTTGATYANETCIAKVLQSELFPSAPLAVLSPVRFGDWEVSATIEILAPRHPPVTVALKETLPWQMAIRRDEEFKISCERAISAQFTLADLATAPSIRSAAAGSAPYLRLR